MQPVVLKNPGEDFPATFSSRCVCTDAFNSLSSAGYGQRALRAIVPQYTVFHENERVELENQLATASSSTTRLDERRGADVNDGG